MFLEKPAFPVAHEIGDAEEIVSQLLESRGIEDYILSKGIVLYVPYYFFSFDIFTESEGRTKIISHGQGALNAHKNQIENSMAKLALKEKETDNEIPENFESEVLKSRLSEKEATELIALRCASEKNALKKNVVISAIELLYVPFWIMNFTVESKPLEFKVNAVNGEVINPEIIQKDHVHKESSVADIAAEVLDFHNWPAIFLESISAVAGFFTHAKPKMPRGSTIAKNTDRNDLAVLFLGFIAIVVIFWVFRKF